MGVIAFSCNSLAQNPTATPLLLQLSPSVDATGPPVATQPPVATEPPAATQPAITDISGILSFEADPIWGPTNLQRGFSTDPRLIGLGSEGIVDFDYQSCVRFYHECSNFCLHIKWRSGSGIPADLIYPG